MLLNANRYARQIILPEIGVSGQEKLQKAKILVIGCGGLGSPVLLYLAAAGVGTLGLVENDVIDESNLQRQILYDTISVGLPKIDEAEKRLKALNPAIKIEKYPVRLSSKNAIEIIGNYDLVIDGSDNFPTRYLVNDACVLLNKPFVYGAIYRFEGQIAVFNYKNGVTYRDLFSNPPSPEQAPNCAEAGVLGVLAGMIGTMQANEALKIVLDIGEPLAGKMLILDSLTMMNRIIKIPKNPGVSKITELIDYEKFCGLSESHEIVTLKSLTLVDLQIWKKQGIDFQLIDVREPWEYEISNLGGELIPLGEIEQNILKISKNKPVIIHCQTGKRALKALDILTKKGFQQIYNLIQ